MYATNDNLQAITSRTMIKDALFSLMKQYPYKDITITQICQEAQIVRQTFYRNFDEKNDILKLHLDGMSREYFAEHHNEDNVFNQLKNFFSFMLVNKEFLKLLSKNYLLFMLEKNITLDITARFNKLNLSPIAGAGSEKYVISFIVSTHCSLLSKWIDEEFAESPETMCKLAQRFLGDLSTY